MTEFSSGSESASCSRTACGCEHEETTVRPTERIHDVFSHACFSIHSVRLVCGYVYHTLRVISSEHVLQLSCVQNYAIVLNAISHRSTSRDALRRRQRVAQRIVDVEWALADRQSYLPSSQREKNRPLPSGFSVHPTMSHQERTPE